MGEFVCRVADANGRVFSHVEAAGTLEEARQKMVDRGLYVYSVTTRGSLTGFLNRRSTRQVGGSDFLILNQQFNTLIKAGLPILRALDLLATRATTPKLRPVITQIRDRVREGKSLSEAVDEAGVFSKVYSTRAFLVGILIIQRRCIHQVPQLRRGEVELPFRRIQRFRARSCCWPSTPPAGDDEFP